MDIWIVDDVAQTRSWLREAALLAFPQARLHEAGDLFHAHRLRVEYGWPRLALIDLRLPDGCGHELIARLHGEQPQSTILIPTIFDDDTYLYDAIVAGASGHVLKDQPVERIAVQLRAHAEGSAPPLSPSLARRILRNLEAGDIAADPKVRSYLQLRARGEPAASAQQQSGVDGAALRAAIRRLRPPQGPSGD
jgi:DNA-binding NarL/FixJ family response regulator